MLERSWPVSWLRITSNKNSSKFRSRSRFACRDSHSARLSAGNQPSHCLFLFLVLVFSLILFCDMKMIPCFCRLSFVSPDEIHRFERSCGGNPRSWRWEISHIVQYVQFTGMWLCSIFISLYGMKLIAPGSRLCDLQLFLVLRRYLEIFLSLQVSSDSLFSPVESHGLCHTHCKTS